MPDVRLTDYDEYEQLFTDQDTQLDILNLRIEFVRADILKGMSELKRLELRRRELLKGL